MHATLREPSGRVAVVLAVIAVATFTALCDLHAETPAKGKQAAGKAAAATATPEKPDLENPVAQLVRDPAVQQELAITPKQRAALDAAYDAVAERLWQLRDIGAGPFAAEKSKLLATMESKALAILEPPQQARLRGLVVQARGWPCIVEPPIGGKLKLSPEQIQTIERITAETRAEMIKIAASDETTSARQETLRKLRTREGTSIQEALSIDQRRALAAVVGKPYDLSQVRPLTFPAPQLKQVDAWVNSEPLKLSALRGKVVAFHFWAFNCGNCLNNLPHYARWHDELASQGLVVLGMHTPETKAEHDVAALRSKVDELAIRYPVAVDRDNQNWVAWANSMWPSVYLVDKRGRVRYWWYGEMNWQGTEGEKFMRERIEQLLAEPD